MFLDMELLEKYNPCEKGKKLFNKLYPNGVELVDLLDNKHIPIEMLHWGAEFLPVSTDELDKYYKRIGVENSINCLSSRRISNSENIYRSEDVENSRFVKLSSTVFNSTKITNSSLVLNSEFICGCLDVNDCGRIINGKSIKSSNNVVNSSNINNSVNIYNCHNLTNCNLLWNCSLCEHSGFGSFLVGCHKVLFSTSLNGESFMLFNQPISKEIFETIWEIYQEKLEKEQVNLILEKTENLYFQGEVIKQFNKMFSLSDDFMDWVRTLPNFDNFIMYQITLNPKWIY